MVVTEFDGFHRKVEDGTVVVTTDTLHLHNSRRAAVTLTIDGRTVVLTQDEAVGLASDLLRVQQLASGGAG